MNIYKPNKLGHVTDLQFDMDMGDALRFNLRGMAFGEDQQILYSTLRGWMNDGIKAPAYITEWGCLYCTSPNSIEHTHCKKCGAPRNFILG